MTLKDNNTLPCAPLTPLCPQVVKCPPKLIVFGGPVLRPDSSASAKHSDHLALFRRWDTKSETH